MKFGVRIMPKKQLLDVQGRAVEQFLKDKAFPLVSCRIGKFIELEITAQDILTGKEQVKRALDAGLYNSLTEQFEIVSLES
jgi:phosphoribosylformylglycinamidine (FGAM) synthase PurS component